MVDGLKLKYNKKYCDHANMQYRDMAGMIVRKGRVTLGSDNVLANQNYVSKNLKEVQFILC